MSVFVRISFVSTNGVILFCVCCPELKIKLRHHKYSFKHKYLYIIILFSFVE